jgi:hypothetical protein
MFLFTIKDLMIMMTRFEPNTATQQNKVKYMKDNLRAYQPLSFVDSGIHMMCDSHIISLCSVSFGQFCHFVLRIICESLSLAPLSIGVKWPTVEMYEIFNYGFWSYDHNGQKIFL